MSSIQLQNALAQIVSIEKQLPEYAPPQKLYKTFQQFVIQEAPAGEQKRIVLSSATQPSKEVSAQVHKLMKDLLETAETGRSAIPPDQRAIVERFRQQIETVEAIEKQPVQLEAQTTRPSTIFPTVEEVKKELPPLRRDPSASELSNRADARRALINLGWVAPIMVVGLFIGSLLFMVIGIATVLWFTVPDLVIFIIDKVHEKQMKSVLEKAKTLDELVPLFEQISSRAQAKFFVELGPDYREKLCKWNEKTYHDDVMRQLCDLVNTLQDDTASKEWKQQAFQSLPLRTLPSSGRYSFQFELRSLLIEKGMTGGTIILQE